MYIVFDAIQNRIGIWAAGTEVVLMANIIFAYGAGGRFAETLVYGLQEYNGNWEVICDL